MSFAFADDFFRDEGLLLVEGVALADCSIDGNLFGAVGHKNALSHTGEMIILLVRIHVFKDLDGCSVTLGKDSLKILSLNY